MRKRPGWFFAFGFLYGLLLFAYGGYLLFLAEDRRSLLVGGSFLFLLFLLMGSILFTALFRQKYRRCQAEYRVLWELGLRHKQIVRMQWFQILPVSLGASLLFPALSWVSVLWYRHRLERTAAALGVPHEITAEPVLPVVWILSAILFLIAMFISRRIFLRTGDMEFQESRYARRYTMDLLRRNPSMETFRKIHLDRTKNAVRRLTVTFLILHLLPLFALLIPMSYGFFTGPDMDHGYDLSVSKVPVEGDPAAVFIPQSTLDALLAVEGVTLVEASDGTDVYTKRFGAPEESVYGAILLNLPEENWQEVCAEILSLPCITAAYKIQNALYNELVTEARYTAMQNHTLLLASALLLASFCGTVLLLRNQLDNRRTEFLTLARLGLVQEDCWQMVCRTYCGKLACTGLTASVGMAVVYILFDRLGGDNFKLSVVLRLGGAAAVYVCVLVLLTALALRRELKPVFTEAYPAYTS